MQQKIIKRYILTLGSAVLLLIVLIGGRVFFKSNQTSAFEEVNKEYAALSARSDLTVATFAGGCFWCMEGPFESIEGVEEAIVGFSGGDVENPSYKQVVGGGTGHRESVQIFYDPQKVTFDSLLEAYWWQVDPTNPYGQFADKGEHYTTAIYYHTDEQKIATEKQIEELTLSKRYDEPIVTKVLRFTSFFPAEDYHQNFYQKSSEYYQQYKKGSGREDYIKAMERKYEDK